MVVCVELDRTRQGKYMYISIPPDKQGKSNHHSMYMWKKAARVICTLICIVTPLYPPII